MGCHPDAFLQIDVALRVKVLRAAAKTRLEAPFIYKLFSNHETRAEPPDRQDVFCFNCF